LVWFGLFDSIVIGVLSDSTILARRSSSGRLQVYNRSSNRFVSPPVTKPKPKQLLLLLTQLQINNSRGLSARFLSRASTRLSVLLRVLWPGTAPERAMGRRSLRGLPRRDRNPIEREENANRAYRVRCRFRVCVCVRCFNGSPVHTRLQPPSNFKVIVPHFLCSFHGSQQF